MSIHYIEGENTSGGSSGSTDLSSYQTKKDSSLKTSDKTVVGAINELFQDVSNGKKLIARAIADKGIPTSDYATFATMANNIDKIPFSISYMLYDCTSTNTDVSIIKSSSYYTRLSATSGTIESISVTMGIIDITADVVNGNEINIPKVTGNIVISATTAGTSSIPLTVSTISSYTTRKNQAFYITYDTNKPVTRHYISWDGGITYTNISSDVSSNGTSHRYLCNGVLNKDAGVYNMAIRVGTSTGELVASNVFNLTITDNSSTDTPLRIYPIESITETEYTEFTIRYTTTKAVVKHEVSWDNGGTFYDKTSDVTSSGLTYTFTHDNRGVAGRYEMVIKVTDSEGNKYSEKFILTLTAKSSGLQFTQYKRLDNGVIKDETDGKYYSTLTKYNVTAGTKYTVTLNKVNYICICYYNSSGTYLSYDEMNTDDWSNKEFTTNFTPPSGATSIQICATGDSSIQVTATINTDNNGLLDASGAYMVDDFTGNSVDSSKWSYELGYVRNGETQRYTNSNTEVNNSILSLKGKKDSSGNWTSSSIISHGHFAFQYGKIECRAKVDKTWGSFSAFWTLGDSFEFGYNEWGSPDTLGEWWAWCGEFDVMEFYSGKLTCGVFFNEREEAGRVWYNNYEPTDWHTYAMEWKTDGTLIFTIDGNELSRTSATDNRAFHIPHYILINQAIGASGGTPADSTTEITQQVDWVKYYPLSTDNVVLNSSDFTIAATDINDNNCVVRPTFNDNCINKSLTWRSSNESIVTVHGGFCCTTSGSANGTVEITAMSQSGTTAKCTLTVVNGKIYSTDTADQETYDIKYHLYNATSSNMITSAKKGSSYSTTITPNEGYNITSINVVMGGNVISNSTVSDNNIYISSVTGEVNITVMTEKKPSDTLTISQIADITTTEKTSFNIQYTTNKAVVKHEVSWDGGNMFYDKTSDVTASGLTYTFTHDDDATAGVYNMVIRVTDTDGNVSTSKFTITLTSAKDLQFTQYKRLNDGVITNETDGTYYSTLKRYSVTSGTTYIINFNKVNYVCICYYDNNNSYLSYDELHTDDWSNKEFTGSFVVPSNATNILICAVGDATVQVEATINKSKNSEVLEILPSTTCIDISEGGNGTFYLKLSEKPYSNVVLNISSSSPYLTVSSSQLTFTVDNWYIAQSINITSTSDNNETDDSYTINISSDNLSNKAIAVNVADLSNNNFEILYDEGNLIDGASWTLSNATDNGTYISTNQSADTSVCISGHPINLSKNDKVHLVLGLNTTNPSSLYTIRSLQLGDASGNNISNANMLSEEAISNALVNDKVDTYWTIAGNLSNINLTFTSYFAKVKIYKVYIERG